MHTDTYVDALKSTIRDVVSKCWNCNFCYSSCPNFDSTRGFQTQGPSGITQSLYYAVKWDRFNGEDARDLCRILYACTTCNACVNTCNKMSAGISLLDAIEAGRQLLVDTMKGPLPRQARCLEKIARHGNPYGKPAKRRTAWVGDRSVKRIPQSASENLLYICCAAALNPELHPVATCVVDLFTLAGVDFGILENEVCCGDPARTMGDHFLLEELIEKNSRQVDQCRPETIFTLSPHCFTTIRKHYATLTQHSIVRHYTQMLVPFLPALEDKWGNMEPLKVTYHDPCYLGKHNGIYDEPRELIAAIPDIELVEMRHNRENNLCCGGGGGRMFEEFEEIVRLARIRVEEALETKANVLATACPWCHQMLTDAVKDCRVDGRIRVMDIAELMTSRLCVA